MVRSKINPSIDYPNIKKLDQSDKELEVIVYKVKINGINLYVSIGSKRDMYLSSGVVYYPIYLIYDDKVISQIGLYEISTDRSATIIGGDNEVDIQKFGTSPLFYPFVTVSFLKRHAVEFEGEEEMQTKITIKKKTKKKSKKLLVVGEDDDEESKQTETSTNVIGDEAPWIQKFMKSTKYNIIDNEGGGDCLFIVISQALDSIGIKKSVAELRKILADNVTEDVFRGYKTMYDDISGTIDNTKKELGDLAKENVELQKQLMITKDRTMAKTLITDGEALKKRRETTKREYLQAKENVKEFDFMKDVKSVDEMRAKIHTNKYWGDTWAISTLERVLNLKLVLFSKESFHNGDLENVLQCGQLNDDILLQQGQFIPRYYILANYLGWHYELITYKDAKTLEFDEIPTEVKNLVVNKCLERNAGTYYIIPQFREYFQKLKKELPAAEEVPETMSSDLFDNDIVFQFYSKSNKGPKPGKGSGEKIPIDRIKEFTELASFPDWRRKLSNFWAQPFQLEGKQWETVEHYYQGSKYKKNNPELYNEFSLDSGSELSKDPNMAKGAGSKKGSFKGKRIIPKGVVVDPDFFRGRSEKTMEDGMTAKFSQNEDLQKILLATKDAKLVHFVRGNPPVVFNDLMRVRRKLSSKE